MNFLQLVIIPTILILLILVQIAALKWFPKKKGHQKKLLWRTSYYFVVIASRTIVLYVGFAMIAFLSQQTFISPSGLLITAITLAFCFAFITVPFSEKMDIWLNRLILGKPSQQRNDKQVIKHYSQSLGSALDIQRVGDTVLHLMIETLGINRGAVFITQRDMLGETLLRPIASTGIANIASQKLATDSPFLDYFRQHETLLKQEQIESSSEFDALVADERTWLQNLEIKFYAPILRQRQLIGFLAFGEHDTTYYDEDLDLMMTLSNQTALAMDSARLFEQLALINEEVGSLNNQLTGFDQKKSDFLSIASHELRTPLTHIHGYSKMILDLTDDELRDPESLKTMIQGIAKGSERLKDVVDMMFDVTEADIGKMSLFVGPVRLERVIDQAIQSLLADFDSRRVAFAPSGIQELPVVNADGTRLVQAFENLFSNALKFTPDGGLVQVEGSIIKEDDNAFVQIVVIDNGVGIDPEFHEKIFEKFFRIDSVYNHSTSKTKFKGAGPGLGLTLVKGIAEAHKGKAWVESAGYDEENFPGSKFFLTLPIQDLAAWDEQEEEKAQSLRQSKIKTRHWRRPSDENGDKA